MEGRAGQALELAERELAQDLPESVHAMVLSVAGLGSFVTGGFELADQRFGLAEEVAEHARPQTPDDPDPWLGAIRVSVPALRCANAMLAEDWAGAEAHLDRAREQAGASANELVIVEHFAAWGAALRGDAGTAMHHASAALELGQQLGDSFYLPMSRILVGWATAMNGDAKGVGVALAAYSECKAISLRLHAVVHLMLCAEASARHGQLDEARALVQESRSMARLTGERTVNDRLEQVAGQILREVQDPSA
jgi:hypothetical protein